jgi:hypothetical protein
MTQRSRHVSGESDRRDEPVAEAARRGQWWGTPFVVLGSVATVVWLVAGLIAGGLLLIWWLA